MVVVQNKIPEEEDETDTNTLFRGHLDKYTDRIGIEGYRPNAGKWD